MRVPVCFNPCVCGFVQSEWSKVSLSCFHECEISSFYEMLSLIILESRGACNASHLISFVNAVYFTLLNVSF